MLNNNLNRWSLQSRTCPEEPWVKANAGFRHEKTLEIFSAIHETLASGEWETAANLLEERLEDLDPGLVEPAVRCHVNANPVGTAHEMLDAFIAEHEGMQHNTSQGQMVAMLGGAPSPVSGSNLFGPPFFSPEGDDLRLKIMEAPTGTGKTLGYLISAAWWCARGRSESSKKLPERVAIVTHTRNLQRQLRRELLRLTNWIDAQPDGRWGPSLRFQHLEGRDNYVDPGEIAAVLRSLPDRDPNAADAPMLALLCAFLLQQAEDLALHIHSGDNPFWLWEGDGGKERAIMSCFGLISDFDLFVSSCALEEQVVGDEQWGDRWHDLHATWLHHATSKHSLFYRAATAWATQSDILVGNHALVLRNKNLWPNGDQATVALGLANQAVATEASNNISTGKCGMDATVADEVMFPVEALVIDEAHNWESSATESLKLEVSGARLRQVLRSFWTKKEGTSKPIGLLSKEPGTEAIVKAAIESVEAITVRLNEHDAWPALRQQILYPDGKKKGKPAPLPDIVERIHLSNGSSDGWRDKVHEPVTKLVAALEAFVAFAAPLCVGRARAVEKLAQIAAQPGGFISQLRHGVHGLGQCEAKRRTNPGWDSLLAPHSEGGLDGYLPTLSMHLEPTAESKAATGTHDRLVADWSLQARRVDVDQVLAKFYEATGFRRILLTSATLSLDHSPEGYTSFLQWSGAALAGKSGASVETVAPLPSRLDYSRARLALPDVQNQHNWGAACGETLARPRDLQMANAISEIVWRVGGRILVLFSAGQGLRETRRLIEKWFSARLAQAPGGPVSIVTHEEEPDLPSLMAGRDDIVIFGLKRCWEGIDIPGLRFVCLDTVYNHPPSPTALCRALKHAVADKAMQALREKTWGAIREHRLSSLSQSAKALDGLGLTMSLMQQKYEYPKRSLATIQGFGRLLRGNGDAGSVVVFGLSNSRPDRLMPGYSSNVLHWNYGNQWLHSGSLAHCVVRALPGFSGPSDESSKTGSNYPSDPTEWGQMQKEFYDEGSLSKESIYCVVKKATEHAMAQGALSAWTQVRTNAGGVPAAEASLTTVDNSIVGMPSFSELLVLIERAKSLYTPEQIAEMQRALTKSAPDAS